MHYPQPAITVLLCRHNQTKCHDVAELFKIEVIALHFLPDRVGCFLATDDVGFKIVVVQRFVQLLDNAAE